MPDEKNTTHPDELTNTAGTAVEEKLEGGAYEVLRKRIEALDGKLCAALASLNGRRKDIFGSHESKLIGTQRVTTDNNCVPRDIVAVDGHMLFGYNVFIGLKTETVVEDVLCLMKFDGEQFGASELPLLDTPAFRRDFQELYKYYRDARFLQFVKTESRLLVIFQIGRSVTDVKIFRWQVEKGGGFKYIDDRGDMEYKLPPQHDFEWTAATRDNQVQGAHPHFSILDQLFVECIGGTLTIKIENNTKTGEGIFNEPVDNPDQTLDDAEIYYAEVGPLILLKVKPYREEKYRYIVYNSRLQTAIRIDAIDQACIELPEDHGIIFPRGYYLIDGRSRVFDEKVDNMRYLQCKKSPNGEDFLYVFYHEEQGLHILLQYNMISKELSTPITCHGCSLFKDGRMIVFNAPDNEPRRNHPMQLWKTPFYSDDYEAPVTSDSPLARIGNRDLVRGISEGYGISRLINSDIITLDVYADLLKSTTNLLDGYHWINEPECGDLKTIVQEINQTAVAAIDEFEKVVRMKENTAKRIEESRQAVHRAMLDLRPDQMHDINDFVNAISEYRARRGIVIGLRDLRYADMALIDEMDTQLARGTQDISEACVEFLLKPDSLKPYSEKNADLDKKIAAVNKVADLEKLAGELEKLAVQLDLLTDVVGNLNIDDATKTTRIVEAITDVYAGVNRTRSMTRNRRLDIGREEAEAEFAAQFKLLSQSITNYIGMCDSAAKCDELLTKIMVSIEELEGRFADYEEFTLQIGEKREEAYNAFADRKQVLEDSQKKRVTSLASSAERILKGVVARSGTFKDVDSINAYFASDLMVSKLRDVTRQLYDMGESVKADELNGKLKTAKETAVRGLRDKLELFTDGMDIITFGDYSFSVNTQPLELTTLHRDGDMFFHLTGTSFYEKITDPEFLATRAIWRQELISENRNVYRAEYLAYQALEAALNHTGDFSMDDLRKAAGHVKDLGTLVRDFAAPRYNEGYDKGIHDHDATLILNELIRFYDSTELLRYDSTSRAHAIIFWRYYGNQAHRHILRNRMRSFGSLPRVFGCSAIRRDYIDEIRAAMCVFFEAFGRVIDPAVLSQAAEFLYYELQDADELEFTINALAYDLHKQFMSYLKTKKAEKAFLQDIDELCSDYISRINLIHDWVSAFVKQSGNDPSEHFIWEVVALISSGEVINHDVTSVGTYVEIKGLLGQHHLVRDNRLDLHFDLFLLKMKEFVSVQVPKFEAFTRLRKQLIDRRREEIRLAEFLPRVMGGFVRNKLISEVYLNLVGANFAKQLGVIGDARRTDQMGLLLLISPPGYGKTTLMEYVANRLGLAFMKINGPAIGHSVTSLDPVEAPNATAREELQKLNLSLEMGNNVMIYLDDIQHCHSEFLQKFISLCDAQRKIEGVYRGKTRTYDLRGRKVAVVMAGNPYTESGEKFRIPDMLANRADTYNLGDISSSSRDAFELSFIENSMTSNPVLSKVATRGHADIYKFAEAVRRNSTEGIEFEHNYSAEEVNETLNVLRKLFMVRDTVLKMNRQYIDSAAQQDEYRAEPPFKLQGSYRNMNRMAEKVYPIMTDEEVNQLIIDHYTNEAQTLTTGAEANLLKFSEILGILTPEQTDRWQRIRDEFQRRQTLGGVDNDDQLAQLMAQLSTLGVGVKNITAAIAARPDIDLSPLVKALQAAGKKPSPIQVNAQFPPEYAEAWARQSQSHDQLAEILNGMRQRSDDFVKLGDLLDDIIHGKVTLQITK
ncbi:MAG: DNA repair ATPase [Lentisphaeria bacterium]|nr:DNA repair ATPase [Lentisphaeria bacterium]